MIVRTGSRGFLAEHYDWLALGVGLVVLGVGIWFFVSVAGEDPDESASAAVSRITRMKPSELGVKPVDTADLQNALRLIKSPISLMELSEKGESFLASESRVLCACGKAISSDTKAFPACPSCGAKRQEEKKVVLDTDGDGLPDEWEKKNKLNPNDASDAGADADGDGFTNFEEYKAGTDPQIKTDHPDYLDSLKIELPLEETFMPFVFRKANKIPAGWRCEFFDPARKDNYGRKGATLTAVVGEEIADTGFILKSHTEKTAREAIKGGAGLTKTVDASEVVVERKQDGKQITLVVQQGKSVKLAPVDVQASLVYERGTVQRFKVVPGSKIILSGTEYKVTGIRAAGKGAKVTLQQIPVGRERTLEALER